MDDSLFIKTFKGLKHLGVREIVDFHAGFMNMREAFFHLVRPFTVNRFMRKLLRKPMFNESDHPGKFHGYTRSRGALRSLYRQAGLRVVKEVSVGSSQYVAILQ
jgi:hypothetical protein